MPIKKKKDKRESLNKAMFNIVYSSMNSVLPSTTLP